jgi:VIT1/CCC1 family predicted Fe2+/Mn2+ transporter
VPQHQPEEHRTVRIGWLRALVLGANDGIVSTASLLVGVAAAQSSKSAVLLAGVAGVVAGAMSMAAGEYVSVSSQSDTERADLAREAHELEVHGEYELEELKTIYVDRGLEPGLASQVAEQLTAHDGLAAHGRDELGISHSVTAKPVQAVFATSVVFLAVLGVVSARLGGAPVLRATLRITFWGVLAMVLTAAVGSLFGVAA